MERKQKEASVVKLNDSESKNNQFLIERLTTGTQIFRMEPANELIFIVKGSPSLTIGDTEYDFGAGDMAFVPAFSQYCFLKSDDTEVYCFKFGQRYMEDFYTCYPDGGLPIVMDDKKKNSDLKKSVLSIQTQKLTEFEKITFVNNVLTAIISAYGVTDRLTGVETQIAEVIGYIYKNYEKDISLESLAKHFCISKMVLSRKLSKYLGVDLRVFVSDIRVKAYIKMRSDKKYANLSAVELAYKCGFKSYETFYRAYKRVNKTDNQNLRAGN